MNAKQTANGTTMSWVLATGMVVALVSMPAVVSAKGGKCDPSICSTNSPVVDGAEIEGQAFHELSVAGEVNAAGFVVTGIRKPGARPESKIRTTTSTPRPANTPAAE